MFSALGRWIKAIGYLLTGQIDAARRTLDTNPYVMRAKYDEILREKTSRIQQYKQAVAGLIAQQENKIQKVTTLTEEVRRLENLKSGALAKAKQKVEALQKAGKTTEEIQRDEDYLRCQAAFKDFSSTLAEKQARIEELEADIGEFAQIFCGYRSARELVEAGKVQVASPRTLDLLDELFHDRPTHTQDWF